MVQWAETWQLNLSIDKCCVLHIGQQQTTSSSVLFLLHSYTICCHQLPVVTHCRDLGVIIANTCQPRFYFNTIVAKASQHANAILRCFQSRDPCVLLRAFKVYVRPILEYNTTHCLVAFTEKSHRGHQKSTTSVYKDTLWTQRLFIFSTASGSIQSLKLRRIHYDLTLTYQIVFGLSVLKCQKCFQLSEHSTTRGHQFKLMKQRCHGYRRYFFNTRVVNIWNFLPEDVVNFSLLHSFKTRSTLLTFWDF